MPTRASEGGLGGAAKLVAERASTIVRLEIELALAELKRKLAALGLGIGMVIGAAVFLLFGLGFGLAAAAAAIALAVPTWAALLSITVGLMGVAGLLALLGLAGIKRGSPPVPEQAIEEAKLTAAAVKNGS